jgi:hypothetical protein
MVKAQFSRTEGELMRTLLSGRTGALLRRLALAALLPLLQLPACKSPTTGPAGAPSGVAIQGKLDLANGEQIAGWAWDRNRPDATISVDIFDGDKKLETVSADAFRDDLAKANIGDGKHAFSHPTPESLKDGNLHTVRVVASGTNVELEGSPTTLKVP